MNDWSSDLADSVTNTSVTIHSNTDGCYYSRRSWLPVLIQQWLSMIRQEYLCSSTIVCQSQNGFIDDIIIYMFSSWSYRFHNESCIEIYSKIAWNCKLYKRLTQKIHFFKTGHVILCMQQVSIKASFSGHCMTFLNFS